MSEQPASPESYWTPLLPALEHADETSEAEQVRRTPVWRRGIALVSALGIGVAFMGTAIPGSITPGEAEEALALAQQQEYTSASATDLDIGGAQPLGALGLLSEPVLVEPESGLIDWSTMSDTTLTLPITSGVRLTDGFGYRSFPVPGFHDAQDMAASAGTRIDSIGDGVVIEAGFASDGCGVALKAQHLVDGQVVTSRYCHMETGSITHSVGDPIARGEQVGRVGNTGLSFGAHLHLVLRVNGEPVDPLPFISRYSE